MVHSFTRKMVDYVRLQRPCYLSHNLWCNAAWRHEDPTARSLRPTGHLLPKQSEHFDTTHACWNASLSKHPLKIVCEAKLIHRTVESLCIRKRRGKLRMTKIRFRWSLVMHTCSLAIHHVGLLLLYQLIAVCLTCYCSLTYKSSVVCLRILHAEWTILLWNVHPCNFYWLFHETGRKSQALLYVPISVGCSVHVNQYLSCSLVYAVLKLLTLIQQTELTKGCVSVFTCGELCHTDGHNCTTGSWAVCEEGEWQWRPIWDPCLWWRGTCIPDLRRPSWE